MNLIRRFLDLPKYNFIQRFHNVKIYDLKPKVFLKIENKITLVLSGVELLFNLVG
jgi:hypothetical protein